MNLLFHPIAPFKNCKCLEPLAPLLDEIDKCLQLVFCRKFNFGQLLYEALFDIIRTFGRNEVKFPKNLENPYALKKFVFVF